MRPRAPATSRPDPTTSWIALAIIGVAVLAAYRGSFAVPFFFDDTKAIVDNPTIRDLGRIGTVLSPPADGGGMAGRPIVNLSLALNYAVGRLDPRGYHVFNLLLHLAAAGMIYALVRRTLLGPGRPPREARSTAALALMSALLWALHPLQTESVTCVIQRTELLGAVFYLLTLLAFVRSVDSPSPRGWQALSVGACAIGMASKEVMVSAPLLVLLYDRTFVAGTWSAAWRQRSTYYGALASTWLVLGALLWQMGGSRGGAAGFGLGVPWWAYALRQCEAVPAYLGLSLWPHPLVLDYGMDLATSLWTVLPGGLLLLALGTLTVAALRWRPRLGFLGVWFFAILAPSSSVVPLVAQTMAEHRMYLPLAAVIIAGVIAGHHLLGPRFRFVAAALAVASGIATTARNTTLQTELDLWADNVAKRPNNPRALASYAVALSNRGRPAEGLPFLQRARALDPQSPVTEQNLGTVYFELGRFPEAAEHFRRSIALNPRIPGAHSSLGATLFEMGDPTGALACYRTALALDPRHPAANRNAGRAYFALGRFAESVAHYAEVLRQSPGSADAHYDYGLALARGGDWTRAKLHLDEAVQLKSDPAAYLSYARFLASAGFQAEALAQIENALRLRPDYPEARQERERLRLLPAK